MINLAEAIEALKSGGVVAIPTDTVYGLAASLDFPDAINSIYRLKERPIEVALPILVANFAQIEQIGVTMSPEARLFATEVWPGNRTLIVPAPSHLAEKVHSSSGTVALRIPKDDLALSIIVETGPLAATSANKHGHHTPTSALDVERIFQGNEGFSGVLNGGTRNSAPSEIINTSENPWKITRQGRSA